MSFESHPATRQGIIPLIFIWGATGGGKTESALRLARGLAGPKGRVTIGDTENKRGLLPFDRIEGGYKHADFQPPFTPERYGEMIEFLERDCDVGVLDSGSYLWNGPDGILEEHEKILDRMVGDDWAKREAAGWRAWKEPKIRLAVFEQRLLRCKIPLVVCFQGEIKSKMVKDERGKTTIQHTETTIPIFDLKFMFKALVCFEIYQDRGGGGLIRYPWPYAKTSHARLQAALPPPDTTRLDVCHGADIATFCTAAGEAPRPAGPSQPAAVPPPAVAGPPKPKLTDDEKKARWLAACLKAAGGASGASYVMEYFVSEGWIMDTEAPEDISVGKLPKTREEADKHLAGISIMAGVSTTPT